MFSGVKPYKCEICGVAFAQKNNLTRHMQVHSDSFTYQCPVPNCDYATKRRDMLKSHMLQHGSLQYQCRMCSNAYFMYPGDLRKHIVKSHKNLGPEQQGYLAQLGKLNDIEMHRNQTNANDTIGSDAPTKATRQFGARARFANKAGGERQSSYCNSSDAYRPAASSMGDVSADGEEFGSFDELADDSAMENGYLADKLVAGLEDCIDLDEYEEEDGEEEDLEEDDEESGMDCAQGGNFGSELKKEMLDSDNFYRNRAADSDNRKQLCCSSFFLHKFMSYLFLYFVSNYV